MEPYGALQVEAFCLLPANGTLSLMHCCWLQAIDFALSRLEQRPTSGSLTVGLLEGNSSGIESINGQLLSLRAEVFRIWTANS